MNYNNISEKKKSKMLEDAVLTQSPEEVATLYAQLGQVENTARALGLACRFSGLAHVKVLVEGGANFSCVQHEGEISYYPIHYWLSPLEMNNILRRASFLDGRDPCFTNSVTVDKKTMHVLPVEQRAEIVNYLYQYRKKVGLDAGELLYYTIMSNTKQILKVLKEYGVKLSDQRITMIAENGRSFEWMEFSSMQEYIRDAEYIEILGNLAQEMDGRTFHYTDSIYWQNYNSYRKQFRLYNPDIFQFILAHFNQKKMNKAKIMKGAIDQNSVICLEICAENGWLDMPRKRDEMIKYASENDKTEASAWLLEFKNRTANFALEREKAEKKMMRELNANPNSITELKKIWGFEKREDDTIRITRYKGKNTEVIVPEKIGNSTVVEIGAKAFSTEALRLKREQSFLRMAITHIVLPETIEVIGERAFCGCHALTQINLPNKVTAIGENAFSRCECLNSIVLPKGIAEIRAYTFSSCKSLQSIIIPGNITVISKHAFDNCTALETVEIVEGIAEIEMLAFCNCTNLKSIVLPQSIHKIKNYTRKGQEPKTIFYKDMDVTAIVMPKSYAEKYCRRNNVNYIYEKKIE